MKATTTDPREAIVERLHANTPNYTIDFDFARHFAALTGRPETSILSNVRELTQHYERTSEHITKRKRSEHCLRLACESIWGWFVAGERGEFNTDDVIAFIESHCQQAVWAVLLGEQYIQRHHPELVDDLNHAT